MDASTDPPVTHRYCASCRLWKHRQYFRARASSGVTYDSVCSTCRPKLKLNAASKTLMKRVNRGVLALETFDRISEKRRGERAVSIRDTKQKNKLDKYEMSWKPVLRAIQIARSVINNRPADTPEKLKWRADAWVLVNEALREYNRRKRREECPFGLRPPWYAVLPAGPWRARELMNEYPGGPDNSPLKVL